MKLDPVALVTELCMELPETTNQPFGGHEAPAFHVRDKIYVKINEDLSGFTCKAPPGVQELLVQSEPERFYVPAYVGRNGWIGVNFVDVDRDELAAIILDSYKMTAPKKLLANLPD